MSKKPRPFIEPGYTREARSWEDAVARKAYSEANIRAKAVTVEQLHRCLKSHGCVLDALHNDGHCMRCTYPKSGHRIIIPALRDLSDYASAVCNAVFYLAEDLGCSFWDTLEKVENKPEPYCPYCNADRFPHNEGCPRDSCPRL